MTRPPGLEEICMEYPRRKSPRLQGYDYSAANYYFVTICAHEKKCLFTGENREVAEQELLTLAEHYSNVRVAKCVIMPNHIHAIVVIDAQSETGGSRPAPTLAQVVGLYKSGVSRRIRQKAPNKIIWQRSYYDRVIRNETEYLNTWKYIDENPLKWVDDELYVEE